jgi:hypothetical protein
MSSHLVGLDLEDLTPRQLRMILRGAAKASKPLHERSRKERDEKEDEDQDENDDLVDLHEEKNGKPKTPKVTKDDLPKGVTVGKKKTEDDEEADEEIA